MKYTLVFSPAREQARSWLENREAAPRLFASELRATLALLTRAPMLGVGHPHPTVQGVRRILLSRTGYHLDFVSDVATATIEVVAIWSAVRGRGPRI